MLFAQKRVVYLFRGDISDMERATVQFNVRRVRDGSYFIFTDRRSNNRPFAAKPSRDLLFIKLWAATLRMPKMEKACRSIVIDLQNRFPISVCID